jgi:Protein of unknown function (DUF1628).
MRIIAFKTGDWKDRAVSPVVGVMLMLIVVVIIAAVVSGFSGGLLGNTEKAPTLSMDVHIKNNGYWSGSYFSARVTGVEKGVATKDLKIVTSWSTTLSNGTHVTGGNTVVPGVNNTFVHLSPSRGTANENVFQYIAPQGFGTGIGDNGGTNSNGPNTGGTASDKTSFGNYDLLSGTSMFAQPFGETARPTSGGHSSTSYLVGYGVNGSRWSYTYGGPISAAAFYPPTQNSLPEGTALTYAANQAVGSYDSMMAVLGANWYNLRAGDVVTVSVIHTPSSKTIWEKQIIVED